MLASLTSEIVAWGRRSEDLGSPNKHGVLLPLLTWIVYAAGAVSGGLAVRQWQSSALVLPLAALLTAIVLGLRAVR